MKLVNNEKAYENGGKRCKFSPHFQNNFKISHLTLFYTAIEPTQFLQGRGQKCNPI